MVHKVTLFTIWAVSWCSGLRGDCGPETSWWRLFGPWCLSSALVFRFMSSVFYMISSYLHLGPRTCQFHTLVCRHSQKHAAWLWIVPNFIQLTVRGSSSPLQPHSVHRLILSLMNKAVWMVPRHHSPDCNTAPPLSVILCCQMSNLLPTIALPHLSMQLFRLKPRRTLIHVLTFVSKNPCRCSRRKVYCDLANAVRVSQIVSLLYTCSRKQDSSRLNVLIHRSSTGYFHNGSLKCFMSFSV